MLIIQFYLLDTTHFNQLQSPLIFFAEQSGINCYSNVIILVDLPYSVCFNIGTLDSFKKLINETVGFSFLVASVI